MKSNTMTLLLALAMAGMPTAVSAKLNIITTVSDLAALIQEIGGEQVTAESICRGPQDPHFLEAKPSYTLKVSRADLVVAIGLDLEIGWLNSILQGARNPKILPGSAGYYEVGPQMNPLEVRGGQVSRSEGDIHPLGNPHVMLDPVRVGSLALKLASKMGQLDPLHAQVFMDHAGKIQKRLAEKTVIWQKRIKESGIKKIVTYHKTLTYFLDRFAIENPAILEPKPGIPPTAKHIIEVIQLAKEQKIVLFMIENYFDLTSAERIQKEVPGAKVKLVPVSVGGDPSIHTLDQLYETLVSAVDGK